MHATLTRLINLLDSPQISGTAVIPWGAPVPAFGDLSRAKVATLGLNPSNREFVDDTGDELRGPQRRFHTLKSLSLGSWSEVDARHLRLMLESCRTYFLGNPYDRWFKKLDQVVAGTGASYYAASGSACHLDLVPFATACKWTDLSYRERSALLALAAGSLGHLLRDSSVRLLILNGKAVVDQFQEVTRIRLERYEMRQWTLHGRRKREVAGFGYKAVVNVLCGVRLFHDILVLGYNHNIQSSFGVTTTAVMAIREWVAQAAVELI